MNDYIEQTKSIMSTWEGHPYDACYSIIKMLYEVMPDEPWEIIRVVISNPNEFGNKEATIEMTSQDELDRLSFRYTDYLNKLVEALSMKDEEADAFYKELYNLVFTSAVLPVEQEYLAFYLYALSRKVKLLPYYCTDNITRFDESEYKNIVYSITPQLDRAFHMCHRKFETKSERTSQYWGLASELESREEQIVFWSVVIEMEKRKDKDKDDK